MVCTKLVSVRLDEDMVNEIDAICNGSRHVKRSDFIQQGVKLILEAHKRGLFYKVCEFDPDLGHVVDDMTFSFHR